MTKPKKCASTLPFLETDVQRPFDERYQLVTGNDLFIDLMNCLTGNVKNVSKVSAIVRLLNNSGL